MLLGSAGCNHAGSESVDFVDDQIAELVASFPDANLGSEADVEHVVANAASSKRAVMFVNVIRSSDQWPRPYNSQLMKRWQYQLHRH